MDQADSQAALSLKKLREIWTLNVMLGLIPVLICLNLGIMSITISSALKGWGDFRQLYTGGYMFRAGERQNFYDYDTQVRYEQKLVPIPAHLPVNHLAYEHLLLLPLSLLPYKWAYLIFFALNIGLAALTACLLLASGHDLTLRWKYFVPCLIAAFLPVWRALLQGQDSILLLALLAAAMFVLDKGRAFEAGMLVGAGLFKFQIVLPIALLFLVWRRWRFTWGFCGSSAVAVAMSLRMVGTHGMHQYVQMLGGMSVRLKSQVDVMHYATSPLAMPNLRGLITGVLGRWLPHVWLQGLIGVCSICVLALAAKFPKYRKGNENRDNREIEILNDLEWNVSRQFSLAVLAASLVSYHFIEHDASILIIPVVAALASLSTSRGAAAVAVFVGMLAGLAPEYGFLGAVPVVILFWTEIRNPHFFKDARSGVPA
jgi:hypothetical protein